jgi:hypothetical protein
MVTLTAYYDAAGHPDDQKNLVVGGYISKVQTWLKFEDRWNKALALEGIQEMHLTDFISNGGDFRSWKHRPTGDKADVIKTLSNIIHKSTHKSFCEAVVLDDWRRVNRTYQLRESRCTPYALAGYSVMHRSIRFWGSRKKNCNLKFVFEDGDKHKGDFIWLMDSAIKASKRALKLIKPNFEPLKIAPLQAADFVAWANKRAMQVKIGDDTKRLADEVALAFSPLVRSEGKNLWGWLDALKIQRFCEQWDAPKRGEHRGWPGLVKP